MKPDYKNWMPKGMIYTALAITALFLVLFIVFGYFFKIQIRRYAGVCEEAERAGLSLPVQDLHGAGTRGIGRRTAGEISERNDKST